MHDVEFILSPLSGELCQVSLTHLAYLHHLLAPFFVLLAREIALLVHLDSLCRVEDLHVELCNLFLQLDSLGSRIELCSLGRELVQFYLIMVLVSVPDGVVTHHGVTSVVVHLVDAGSRETVTADTASHPRSIVYALVGAGAERRKQSSFRLQIVFLGAGLGELRLLKSDVVGKRIVDTVFQRPLFCLRSQWCRHEEQSSHCVFYFSVHNLLLFSFYPVLFISERY